MKQIKQKMTKLEQYYDFSKKIITLCLATIQAHKLTES